MFQILRSERTGSPTVLATFGDVPTYEVWWAFVRAVVTSDAMASSETMNHLQNEFLERGHGVFCNGFEIVVDVLAHEHGATCPTECERGI